MSIQKRKKPLGRYLIPALAFLGLVILAVPFVFPFFWILSSALQTTTEQYSLPLTWWPKIPQWHNFIVAWKTMPFGLYLWHSVVLVFFVTLGTVLTSALCAYGFARIRFWGRNVIFMAVMATLMLPSTVTLIPLYLIMKHLGWLDTYYPLIVPAFFGGGGYNIFLLRQFMLGIPQELEAAARIDGASRFGLFYRIMLPSMKPALAVVAWGAIVGTWSDFMLPLVYLTSIKKLTFTLGLYALSQASYSGWANQLTMAMSIISMLPVIIGFFFVQGWLIEGINLTGLSR